MRAREEDFGTHHSVFLCDPSETNQVEYEMQDYRNGKRGGHAEDIAPLEFVVEKRTGDEGENDDEERSKGRAHPEVQVSIPSEFQVHFQYPL